MSIFVSPRHSRGYDQKKVAIVTGASRGLGRGCALVLARDEGFTVYATGRTTSELKTLEDECNFDNKTDGKLIPITLDQGNDDFVKAFVNKVKEEQGSVDVLVNSAYGGLAAQKPHFGKCFWEQPIAVYDGHMKIGLRSAYVMSALIAPMMVKAKKGLICQVSSAGGLIYLFDVGYGVMHAGLDRLSADMAAELKEHGVHAVTLWPGGARTEKAAFPQGETPIFVGRAVAALARAPAEDMAKFNGKVVTTSELATKYKFFDADGKMPEGPFSSAGYRAMMAAGPALQYNLEGGVLPDWSQTNGAGISDLAFPHF